MEVVFATLEGDTAGGGAGTGVVIGSLAFATLEEDGQACFGEERIADLIFEIGAVVLRAELGVVDKEHELRWRVVRHGAVEDLEALVFDGSRRVALEGVLQELIEDSGGHHRASLRLDRSDEFENALEVVAVGG